MIVFEIDIAAISFNELAWGNEVPEVFVVFELFARGGVDEGRDDFHEAPDEPGHCFVEEERGEFSFRDYLGKGGF